MLAPQDYEQYDVLNAPGSLVSGFTTGRSDSGPWPAQSLTQLSTNQDGTSSQELQQGPARAWGAAILTGRPLTAASSVCRQETKRSLLTRAMTLRGLSLHS